MIAPLPPQTGLPQQLADPAGARPDPKGEGDAFAEILAAAAAAAPPIPGPAPTLEHGPAVMRITDIEMPEPVAGAVQLPPALPAQAALTDPVPGARPARPDQPQPAARIFNQDGFFGTSVDAAGGDAVASAPAARTIAGITSVQLPVDADAESAAIGELPATTAATQPLPPAARTGGASPAALPHVLRGPTGSLTAPAALRPFLAEADAADEPVKPLARRLANREPAARAAVQVAMRELEQGIHVAARAEGLDAAERVRLHDEIAALLSRHGLSARSIRISAPHRARTSEEQLK